MKTLIAYFSGTGNSLRIAKELSENMPDVTLSSITALMRERTTFSDYSRIVLVYPIYYVGLPLVLQRFIAWFDFSRFTSIYYVCTSGDADGVDCSTFKINRLLKAKGKKLMGGFNLQMPGNYIKMYDVNPQEMNDDIYAKAREKVKAIATAILNNAKSDKRDKLLPLALLINGIWQSNVRKSDRKYSASSACTGCGICERICPVNNIELIDRKPSWKNACEECMACVHFCPQKAINTKTTLGRGRYHHPAVTSADMIAVK